MTLPIDGLTTHFAQIGMVVAVLLGFGFGFTLERAGFGRATKLAAQFYLYDMTVFKVMFGAIVTAMLGVVLASGLGIVDLASLSQGAVSGTFVWPMLFGGLLLGAGFIISGYCPGTSTVAMASGNLDGLATILGVVVGSLAFAESFPLIATFHVSGDKGQLFLYEWLGLSPALLAVIVAAVAVAAFFGAEKVEAIMTKRIAVAAEEVDEEVRRAPAPRRLAFGVYAVVAVAALVTLLFPVQRTAQATEAKDGQPIAVGDLAHRVFDEPWGVRIIDLRAQADCAKQRIPGSECVSAEGLGELGLEFSQGKRDLVLVAAEALETVPEPAAKYPGDVLILEGGYEAWHTFALTAPEVPGPDATEAELEEYRFRAAIGAALAGRKAPPPPTGGGGKFVPKKKKKGGGCG